MSDLAPRDVKTAPSTPTDDPVARSSADSAVAIRDSWRRCRAFHALDPQQAEEPQALNATSLARCRERAGGLLRLAGEDLDRLHASVARTRYAVLLSGPDAVILDHRVGQADAAAFRRHGAWSGGTWSEEVEGTNAIAAAITNRRPMMVQGREHFRRRNEVFSCIAVPILDPDGEIVAALTLARTIGEAGDPFAPVALGITMETARVIEQRQFRTRFSGSWVLLLAPPDDRHPPVLLALDRDYRIAGADHQARTAFGLSDECLASGVDFWTLFERDPRGPVTPCAGDQIMSFMDRQNGETWRGVITPPLGTSRTWGSDAAAILHTRPRWLGRSQEAPAAAHSSADSVLAPHVIRRVTRHIDAHLGEPVTLAELASIAGLSQSHFSEAFRGTTGMPPHRWILERRIERAKHLLQNRYLPITDVALRLGFANSSHFASSFRKMAGMSPSEYRGAALVKEVA